MIFLVKKMLSCKNFFMDIGRLAPTVSPVGYFLPKKGVRTRGGEQNRRKSRNKLQFIQNVHFYVTQNFITFGPCVTTFFYILIFSWFFYSFSQNFFYSISTAVYFLRLFNFFKHTEKIFFSKTSYFCRVRGSVIIRQIGQQYAFLVDTGHIMYVF